MKQYKYFIGIDVGLTGAIVALNSELKVSRIINIPTLAKPGNPSVKEKLDAKQLHYEFELLSGKSMFFWSEVCVFVEDPGIIPTNGVFRVGSQQHSVGVVEGVLGALGCDYRMINAQKWKKRYNLPGGRHQKTKAIELAQQLNPELGPLKIKDADTAEAALVCRYGVKYVLGYNPTGGNESVF